MNFSTDRDLLAHEPTLFADIAWLAQQRIRANGGVLDADELTCAAADFNAAGVGHGHVVLVARTPLEVVDRIDDHTLRVSQLRTSAGGDLITPAPQDDAEVVVRTFAPQAALVRDVILRMIGIDPDDPEAPLDEDAVVSLSAAARLEALGTMERIYASAAAIDQHHEAFWVKQQHYRRRFGEALRTTTLHVDVNGDGLPEERRCPGVVRLRRD